MPIIEIVIGDPFFFDMAESEVLAEIAPDGGGTVLHLDWTRRKVDDQALTAACAMSFVPTVVALHEPPRKLLTVLGDTPMGVDALLFEFESADLKGELFERLEGEGRVHRPGFVTVGEEDRLRRIVTKQCEKDGLTLDAGGLAEVVARAPRRPKPKGAKRADDVYNLRRLRSELRKVRDFSGGEASLQDVRAAMNDWGREVGAAWDLISALSSGKLEQSLRIAPVVSREGVWGFVSLLSSQARLVARLAAVVGRGHPSDADVMAALRSSTPYHHWEADDNPTAEASLPRVRRILGSKNNLIWRRHADFIEACAWAHDALVAGGNANSATVLDLLCIRICSLSD